MQQAPTWSPFNVPRNSALMICPVLYPLNSHALYLLINPLLFQRIFHRLLHGLEILKFKLIIVDEFLIQPQQQVPEFVVHSSTPNQFFNKTKNNHKDREVSGRTYQE